MSVILNFAIFPTDKGDSVSQYVAKVIGVYREAIDSLADGTYSPTKVEKWMDELHKVYNRGFWSGYYLGQEMGEWTKQSGSSATQKKVYIGKGMHYYAKPKAGVFQIEAHSIKEGDDILIIGPTTGVIETKVGPLRIDNNPVDKAKRGDICSFEIEKTIRPSDKLYKIEPA